MKVNAMTIPTDPAISQIISHINDCLEYFELNIEVEQSEDYGYSLDEKFYTISIKEIEIPMEPNSACDKRKRVNRICMSKQLLSDCKTLTDCYSQISHSNIFTINETDPKYQTYQDVYNTLTFK